MNKTFCGSNISDALVVPVRGVNAVQFTSTTSTQQTPRSPGLRWSGVMNRHRPIQALLATALICGALVFGLLLPQTGQAADTNQTSPEPIARLVPIAGTIGEETLGQVRRTLLALQDTALREERQAFLILEFAPGTSSFHNSYALADFLSETPFSNVTTVAWVPETVTGFNVLPVLACQEIVISPDAALGDIGNGQAVSTDQQTIIRTIIDRRRNPRVTNQLVAAMMNPDVSLVQLTVETSPGERETRLATSTEARELQEAGTVIFESRTISEAGLPGLISATLARSRDILLTRTAESRRDLVEGLGLTTDALRELTPAEPITKVAYIQLHHVIDEVFEAFARRQIERAVHSGAQVIVFEIDSPGGLLSVCRDLSQTIASLSERNVKTVAYIPRQAISGGAILAVACDEIYMSPDATIGDAIPVNLMGNTIVHAEEKILSIELELLRNLAERKNRPAAVLEGFADKNLEVFEVTQKTTGRKWYMTEEEIARNSEEWIPGPRVPESRPGIAITVNGRRAHDLKIAESPVQNVNELKQRLGIPDDLAFNAVGRTWVDTLVFTLNNQAMAGFLFFIAVVCIYIELATMTGFFGILSALAFAIFFWSKVMGGTAGTLELAIFAVGLGCLAMELFVVPGFGVFGISGILLVLGSLVMASQTLSGFSLEYDLVRAGQTVATFGASLVMVMIVSALISRNMHRIPLLKELVLTPPGQGDSPDAPKLRPELTSEFSPLLGATGEAVTVLRPSGKALIEGRLVDVISDGPFVPAGANVVVVQVQKNRVVVREA